MGSRKESNSRNLTDELAGPQPERIVWGQIDESFFNLLLHPKVRERQKALEKEVRRIYWENRNNKNNATIPAQWMGAYIADMEAGMGDLFEAFDTVLEKSGKRKTPQLVRAFHAEVVLPCVASRVGTIWQEFHRLFGTVKGVPDEALQGMRGRLDLAVMRLKDSCYVRTEKEAKELECERESATRTDVSAPSMPARSRRIFRALSQFWVRHWKWIITTLLNAWRSLFLA